MSTNSSGNSPLTESKQSSDQQLAIITERQKKTVKRLDRYAWLLDSQFQLPGTSFRFGWDAIIGLIPGIGDILSFGLSALLVLEAKLVGAPFKLILRMLTNIFVEMIIGIIPFFGDLLDVYWKANVRNVDLLKSHLNEIGQQSTASKRWLWLAVYCLALLSLFTLFGYLVWSHRDFILSLF